MRQAGAQPPESHHNKGRRVALSELHLERSCRMAKGPWQPERASAMPSDQRIDGGDNCLSLAALVPPQISALVEPFDSVVIEHARKR